MGTERSATASAGWSVTDSGLALNVVKHSQKLHTADELPVAVDVYLPEAGPDAARVAGPLPVTVVCHGFKGFKDWGMFPFLCAQLAASGRAVACFDQSHNGVGDAPGEFTRLDLFREQTPSLAVADLGLVLAALVDGSLAPGAELRRRDDVSVVGHSMGGGVALLAAVADGRIGRLATLNGVATFDRFGADARRQLERDGAVTIVNTRTGQEMPLGRPWFDDAAKIDLQAVARAVTVPALVVQGADDPNVEPEEGRRLQSWIPDGRLALIDGGDHTFGARHPFVGTTPALDAVLAELQAFLPQAPLGQPDRPDPKVGA